MTERQMIADDRQIKIHPNIQMLQYDSIEVYEGKYSLQHFKYKHTTISYRLVFAEVNAVLP